MVKMTYYLDLFAGIGGFALGAKWAGMKFDRHYFSEVDDYAIRIYEKNFPGAIELGDTTKIDYSLLPKGEWYVSGGFPCQPHSCAGKRKASADERDLWDECRRALCELRPKIALFENVTGLFTSERERFFNRVLSDISASGYNAEWQVLSAADFGAPHLRKRVWIVAYPQSKRWGTLQENKDTACKKSSREKNTEWKDVRFKTAGNYSVELWKGNESFVCGMDDGLPDWMDRLKCCGNAIVPQVAAHLWERIKEAV
jgi:DNA (cytosine-5)-methyltransferase 1